MMNRPHRTAGKIVYVMLAAAGLVTGLAVFFLILLSQPLRTKINIVDSVSIDSISLDEIVLAENNEDVVDWSEGVRKRVYVHPDFPIRKVEQKDPYIETILVFGVDSPGAPDVASRADSLILITVDRGNKAVKLTFIMRDTQVPIEGRSEKDRINAAYAYGGVGLLINTINDVMDLDIQRFAMFDFWNAENLVDFAGGIELRIEDQEIPFLNQCLAEQNALAAGSEPSLEISKAGLQQVDGRQAIAWSRIRKLDLDYNRTSRQRVVMIALLRKFSDSGLTGMISMISSELGYIETNMRNTDMIRLGSRALPLMDSISEYRVPEEGLYSVKDNPRRMIVDWDEQIAALHEFIWKRS